MTTLLLIRHGIAEDPQPGQRDAERALTPEGWTRTRAAMAGLVRLGLRPTRGFNSPYRRAAETMTCLQEAAGAFPMETSLGLVPEARPAQADLWLRGLLAGAAVLDVEGPVPDQGEALLEDEAAARLVVDDQDAHARKRGARHEPILH